MRVEKQDLENSEVPEKKSGRKWQLAYMSRTTSNRN
jgi:hypothetical protein